MNSKQANQIPVQQLLGHMGIKPVRKSKQGYLFPAVYREDKNPSLYVVDERWKDLATGEHGRTLDLVVRIYKCSVSEALSWIDSLVNNGNRKVFFPSMENIVPLQQIANATGHGNPECSRAFLQGICEGTENPQPITISYQQIADIMGYNSTDRSQDFIKKIDNDKERISIGKEEASVKRIQQLQNKALVEYIESRGINKSLAQKYCQEIYLDDNGKNHFYIAFANDNNGYALRNKYHKRIFGKNGITTIKGNEHVALFEGFVDFLSALVLWPEKKENTFIVLNSVVNLPSAIDKLKKIKAATIEIYFDNDNSGERASKELLQHFSNAVNRSDLYKPFKDVNEFLINHK